jgi:pilus assembly protein CpaC
MRRFFPITRVLSAVVFGALLLVSPPAQADENNIEDVVMVVNRQEIIEVPYKLGNIILGGQGVNVRRFEAQKQLLVYAQKPVRTNIYIYDTSGVLRDEVNITVVAQSLRRVVENLKILLTDIEGIDFKMMGDRVFIVGEVALEEEFARVRDLADSEELVVSQVALSDASLQIIAGVIEQDIAVPGVRANLINGRIILEGIVHSEEASDRAEAIAKAYHGNTVNVLEVREVDRIPGHAKTVTLLVHYVELAKSLSTVWGIQWSPLAADEGFEFFLTKELGGSGWGATTGVATATISSLLPRVERARASGHVRVLENPTVSVKSGETAQIFSGFEYPYLVSDGLVQSVEWKDVGIGMTVTPYTQGNDVDMRIEVDVTSLGEVAPNGFQAIDKSQIVTSEFCRAGESIVIGGLQRVLTKVAYNRIPQNDVQGAVFNLYTNKDYKKSKSQFLVFMTPKIHESSSSANRAIKDAFNLQEVRH